MRCAEAALHVSRGLESSARRDNERGVCGMKRGAWIVILSMVGVMPSAHSADPALRAVPLVVPAPQTMPDGPLGEAVRQGLSIVNATKAALPDNVGNALNCASCHLNGGTVANAAPFVGLWGVFPEYFARSGRVETLADRVNDCFARSMNGKPIAVDGSYVMPPLWGSQSFNDGAGMARPSVVAAVLRAKMPLGRGGSLDEQDAWDLAAFVSGAPRPAFAGGARDYPKGGRPSR